MKLHDKYVIHSLDTTHGIVTVYPPNVELSRFWYWHTTTTIILTF